MSTRVPPRPTRVRHRVLVRGLPPWLDAARILGPGGWTPAEDEGRADGGAAATATLDRAQAADLGARLRGLVLDGRPVRVEITPGLPRGAVRAARLDDARRRRQATAGFVRRGTRLDREGRLSLTPEALALAMAEGTAGARVVDACCGAGGNAIAFARQGATVLAVDRDAHRLELARHNARVYGVASRIRFVRADATVVVEREEADLLFVDPPWGEAPGRAGLTLADVPPLEALLTRARARAAYGELWAKLPPAFPVRTLGQARAEAWFGAAEGDARRVKLLLVRWALAPRRWARGRGP